MYVIYRALTALSMVVLAPYYALRGWRRGEKHAFRERFGALPAQITDAAAGVVDSPSGCGGSSGAIWIHAVSVGEVLAAKPLVEGLKRRMPSRRVYVSTTTETGQQLARERLKCADAVFYFPLDWVFPVRRALRQMRPALVVIMETEIWPNFLREARKMGVPVVFANARISERSFARYNRWKFLTTEFYMEVMQDAELFLAQSEEDAMRLRAIGASEERVEVAGNLKYDSEPPAPTAFGAWLSAQVAAQERWPVLVAGSVVALEEEAVLAAYDIVQRQFRRALLVLAPRKPDRFDAAADIAEAGGWHVVRRSRIDVNAPLDEGADVLLLDSIGELAGLYALADAVFVGGSLVSAGGHNILEPAWFGRVPVFGASMENFRDMADRFLNAKAAIQVHSGPELGKVWAQLIEAGSLRERMGQAARAIWDRNRGATERCLERITEILEREERERKGSAA
ncbi:MAG TPA: 3-deoxy-D-manno-octulosonic acid transferase [Candidatus Acidoferrales bacterium]|nr:3-deoxy-D-manno-octulosonic acid transferase [Candidatus Acidoferrales bacterium]